MDDGSQRIGLRRALGLWSFTIYGLGDILGAGIYALVGAVAGLTGGVSWLSFAVAMGVAMLTGLSYAELGARFPKSGGEAYFCQRAFARPRVSLLVGWLVFSSGVVSLATISNAFAENFYGLVEPDRGPPEGAMQALIVIGLLLVLGGINFWGIRQSSTANIVCTAVEASGLLLVIVVGAVYLLAGGAGDAAAAEIETGGTWPAVMQGAAIAFFAFIGFEDMVNISEEVRSPERTIPAGILIAPLLAGAVYMVVVSIATAVVPPARLAEAGPKALLVVVDRAAPALPPVVFGTVTLFAVANTGLLNFIMASRLLYGMAEEGLLPRWLAAVHPRNRTPHRAIATILAVALALALLGTLVQLAETTSCVLLLVFATINTALLAVKLRGGDAAGFRVPWPFPVAGLAASVALTAFVGPVALYSAAGLVTIGLLLVAAYRPGSRRGGDRPKR